MHPTGDDKTWDFEDLVSAYYRPLYQFAYSLVHHEAEASDLTQQTFYIWARKGHTLRDPSKAKTWLFTTLHREFLKSRRHQRLFPHRTIDEADDDLPDPSPSTVEQLDSDAVLEALATLDEIHRAPLALFYLGEHSYKEISDILSVPIGTVQSRISRGKAQLRGVLTRGGTSNDGTSNDGSEQVHGG
jgi:RNA polymerase sigma-70 factor (ECF subfamily)